MKYLSIILATSLLFYGSNYTGSTTAVVCLVGGMIKAKNVDNDNVNKKYKRKDCPVCKGQGWYWSGDKIKKIECQYCEPESSDHNPSCKTKVSKK